MRFSTGILLPALIVLICGCASQSDVVFETREAKQYQQSFEAFTREDSLYNQLDTQLLVRATLLTEPFQDAYWREYARVYHLDADQLAAYREKENVRFGEGIGFLVQVASRAPKLAALEPDKGLWRLTLTDGEGLESSPIQVVRIKKPTADDHYFFPYTKSFGDTYLLRFPPYPGWTIPDGTPAETSDVSKAGGDEKTAGGKDATSGTNPQGASIGATVSAPVYSGPKFVDSRRLLLEFAGTLGRVVLEWDQGKKPER